VGIWFVAIADRYEHAHTHCYRVSPTDQLLIYRVSSQFTPSSYHISMHMNAHTLPYFLYTSHRPFLLRHLTLIIIKDTCCTAVNVGQPCETPQKYTFNVFFPVFGNAIRAVWLVSEVSLIVIICTYVAVIIHQQLCCGVVAVHVAREQDIEIYIFA